MMRFIRCCGFLQDHNFPCTMDGKGNFNREKRIYDHR